MIPRYGQGYGQDSTLELMLNGEHQLSQQFNALTLSTKNYELKPRSELFSGDHDRGVWRVCAIGNDRFATASYDHTAKICSSREGREIFTFKGHRREVLSLALVDENTIATGSSDGTIKSLEFYQRSTNR